jgi:hypothetical protein
VNGKALNVKYDSTHKSEKKSGLEIIIEKEAEKEKRFRKSSIQTNLVHNHHKGEDKWICCFEES